MRIGDKVLAIAHNGNLNSGMMFMLEDLDGNPFTTDYAEARALGAALRES